MPTSEISAPRYMHMLPTGVQKQAGVLSETTAGKQEWGTIDYTRLWDPHCTPISSDWAATLAPLNVLTILILTSNGKWLIRGSTCLAHYSEKRVYSSEMLPFWSFSHDGRSLKKNMQRTSYFVKAAMCWHRSCMRKWHNFTRQPKKNLYRGKRNRGEET